MSFFNQASNFVIEKGTFVHNVPSGGLNNLYRFFASGASHDTKAQDAQPKCHPNTRTQLLDDIHEWVKLPEKETGIYFLHGPAGAGKSCIARTVCEKASKEGLLGASFFFWRSASDRNNESKLITTIAYQLAQLNDELGKKIGAEIEHNPKIVDMPLAVQFQKLIYDPCLSIPRERLRVRAIVIDGLDECIDQMIQVAILQLFAKAVRTDKFPLGFFITSRPESHIQEAFNSKETIFALQTISLDCVEGVSQDIRTVIQSGFSLILNNPNFKMALRSVARPWPPPASVEKLVERSSGQFIYSATVMKFISSPNHNPDAQLQIVLGIKDSNRLFPLADLDLLYYEILSRVPDTERTMKVLSYIIVLKQPLVKSNGLLVKAITKALAYNQCRLLLVVEQLLGIPQGEAYFALNQLHSVLSLKVRSQSFRHKSEIKFHHRSFYDFLITKKRSTTFNVRRTLVYLDITRSCLRFMSLPKYETKDQYVGWVYSYFLWDTHIDKISLNSGELDIKLPTFDLAFKRYFIQGYSQILNVGLLKQAIDMLGLQNSLKPISSEKNTVQNLINHGSLSEEEQDNMTKRAMSTLRDRHSLFTAPKNCSTSYDYVLSSFLFPVLHKHLLSYNNDSMVKQVLALFSIINFGSGSSYEDTPTNCIFRDTESPFGLLFLKISQCISHFQPIELNRFLSTSQHSGAYHCTPDDYANAYIHLFSLSVWLQKYMILFRNCINSLEILKPAATPALMAGLKSEATYFPRNSVTNRLGKQWIRGYVNNLLSWLKKLPNPPQDVIKAWNAVRAYLYLEMAHNETTTQQFRNGMTTSSKTTIESFLLACGVTPSESASLVNR